MSRVRSYIQGLVGLIRNPYFLGGLVVMMLIGAVAYVVVDDVLMPGYTRHDVAIQVPDVMSMPFEAAVERLAEADLTAEEYVLRKPNLPRDTVIDQRPHAGALVKPGRRVYLTVNTGDTTTVSVPRVIGLSLREAQSRMVILGLTVPEVLPDSIPASHANTVTRQEPEPGERVPHGTDITLWYSTGLGDAYVEVPDLTGMPTDEAQELLLRLRLRSVVLGDETADAVPLVLDHDPEAGTRVREGTEIRLRISDPRDDEDLQ